MKTKIVFYLFINLLICEMTKRFIIVYNNLIVNKTKLILTISSVFFWGGGFEPSQNRIVKTIIIAVGNTYTLWIHCSSIVIVNTT